MTYKSNPVELANDKMRRLYKSHLCLHCLYLSYWDWYICRKRHFTILDFSVRELMKMWRWRFVRLLGNASSEYLLHHLFDIDQFIPDKPIRKCKFYQHSERGKFWTETTSMDGTTWKDER